MAQTYAVAGLTPQQWDDEFFRDYVRMSRYKRYMGTDEAAIIGALVERFLFRSVIRNSKREESTMLLAAGIAFFLDAVILLVFGEKQRGLPKIVDGVLNWDFIIIMPYDRILIGVLALGLIAARAGS